MQNVYLWGGQGNVKQVVSGNEISVVFGAFFTVDVHQQHPYHLFFGGKDIHPGIAVEWVGHYLHSLIQRMLINPYSDIHGIDGVREDDGF